MSLATCADCGHELSTAAQACPQCGRPQRTFEATVEGVMQTGNVVFGFIALALLIWILYLAARLLLG